MTPRVEQLPDRLCPSQASDFLALVNDQWTQLAWAPRQPPMAPMVFNPALSAIADSWAADMAGLGGDDRDVGPQTDTVGGWWTGNAAVRAGDVKDAAVRLANAPTLVHGNAGLSAGVGFAGDVFLIINGLPAREGGAVPPAAKNGESIL